MRFTVDEDLATDIARIGRRLGLDIISVHEVGREGWTDEQQLVEAAIERRCVVTGNRRDFEYWTKQFFFARRPHAGVLIVQGALRAADPSAVARALLHFEQTRGDYPMEYMSHFLNPADSDR